MRQKLYETCVFFDLKSGFNKRYKVILVIISEQEFVKWC